MDWQFTPYAAPLFAGSAMMIVVIALSWQRRSTPGAYFLLLIGLSSLFAVLGYALEIGSSSIDTVLFWFGIEYTGVTTMTVWLLLLALTYTGRQRLLTPLTYTLLLLIPLTTQILAWTNQQHELIWVDLTLKPQHDLLLADFKPGAWYWVNIIYTVGIGAIGFVILLRAFLRSAGLYRRQLGMLVLGGAFPFVFFFIYIAGLAPENLDITPYGYVMTSTAIAWGLFNYQLFDIRPVAREAVLAGIADAVLVLDTQNRVVDLNPSAQKFLGTGMQAVGCLAKDVFANWPEMITRYQEVGQTHEEIVITVQGEKRYFDLRLSTLQRQGKNQGRLFVLHDITDRVQVENSLKEANQRLGILRLVDADLSQQLSINYVAAMALDAAMRMSMADTALIGLTTEEGIRVIQVLGEFERNLVNTILPRDKGVIGRVVRSQTAKYIADVTAEPDYIPIALHARAQITLPLLSGDKPVGILSLTTAKPERFTSEVLEFLNLLALRIGVAVDNARLYEELGQLVKELNAFAHTVAHDLKNPLAVISSYAELTLMLNPEGKTKDFVTTMYHSAQKAIEIINALLLLAGVRSAEKIEIAALDMAAITASARLRFANLIEEQRAEIIQPVTWPVAKGYGPWVEEIWANYLNNAIKYGGRPPRLELGYDQRNPLQIRFWIKDNGAGLTPEQQTKLFRPFTRLSQTDIEGHGLGLSIVQRIVERLHGEVGVESVVGQGSLFYFTLPAASDNN